MAAVGAIVGPGIALKAFLFTGLAGGVLAILVAVRRRRLAATLAATGHMIAAPADTPEVVRSAGAGSRFTYRSRNRDRQRARGAREMSRGDAENENQRATGAPPERSGAWGPRERGRWGSGGAKPPRSKNDMRRLTRRLIKNERGAALLETAITIPLILLISVAIFEFGRAYQTWQVLTNAAREGARIAILNESHRRSGQECRQQLHVDRAAEHSVARQHVVVDRAPDFIVGRAAEDGDAAPRGRRWSAPATSGRRDRTQDRHRDQQDERNRDAASRRAAPRSFLISLRVGLRMSF